MPKKQKYLPTLQNDHDLLIVGARAVGLRLTNNQLEKFFSYLSLLQTWNSKINLTSIKDPSSIIRLHFLDSLAITPFISPNSRMLDIGSGAGLPGIPVKIALPQKEVVLVESQRKKANFLKEVGRMLGVKGLHIVEGRAETFAPEDIGPFREIVTRALGTLKQTLRIAAPFLCSGGDCLVMHGPKGIQQFQSMVDRISEFEFSKSRLESYFLPIGNERRNLLIYNKK